MTNPQGITSKAIEATDRTPSLQSHKTLLILGGTTEGALIAEAACALPGLEVITSLAGRTHRPRQIPGRVRRGGFGGEPGLSQFLVEAKIDLVINATHPYATQISRNAIHACRDSRVPYLRVERPPWHPRAGDRWTSVSDLHEAATTLKHSGLRIFVTSGQDVAPLSVLNDAWCLVRLVDDPGPLPLPNYELIISRGPFSESEELSLMRLHKIDVLLAKNSGGDATYAKLAAARRLSLPVVMVNRPITNRGYSLAKDSQASSVDSIDAALGWLRNTVKNLGLKPE